jgi:hypothetical protein
MSAFAQWLEKSREEGREEGRTEGARETLERQLRIKFKRLPRAVRARLAAASAAELEAWTDRVVLAERLDDVFTDPPPPSRPAARSATRRAPGRTGTRSRRRS